MNRRSRTLAIVALLAAVPTGAAAFQRETTDDPQCVEADGMNCPHRGTPLFWATSPVAYVVNPADSDVGASAALSAVEAAFETWETESGDAIEFDLTGTSSGGSDGQDRVNTVSWTRFSESDDIFARSILTYLTDSGEIVDVDVEMNPDFIWAILPEGSNNPIDPRTDVQEVMTHEAGHLLGLDHENRFGQDVVMYFSDTTGNATRRSLSSDDRSGVRAIYPGGTSGDGDGGGGGGCNVGATALRWPDLCLFAILAGGLALRYRRRGGMP